MTDYLTGRTTPDVFETEIHTALLPHMPRGAFLEGALADVMSVIRDLIAVPCVPCRSLVEGGDQVGDGPDALHPQCAAELYGNPALVEHCVHTRAMHDRHHGPVKVHGCPWCMPNTITHPKLAAPGTTKAAS
ncbi:hypothetical protein [Streptomyces sp. NPDC096153]|uniref:hypothetical protein n=1 Tax=Streptomyces sp. NPDC096153 TaxID=3155548 RepID=UPI00331EF27E